MNFSRRIAVGITARSPNEAQSSWAQVEVTPTSDLAHLGGAFGGVADLHQNEP
jgi:hypothetical protein